MYSAVHQDGKRLYELARAGLEVERAPRTVHIYSIDCVGIFAEKLVIAVKCSKGTYIRALAQDIGTRLGCGAYLTALRRTEVAGFEVESAVTLEQLEARGPAAREALLPAAALVTSLPKTLLATDEVIALCQGQPIVVAGLREGETALFGPGPSFLGVGVGDAQGRLVPVRLLATGK